jgi:hypothetical protein
MEFSNSRYFEIEVISTSAQSACQFSVLRNPNRPQIACCGRVKHYSFVRRRFCIDRGAEACLLGTRVRNLLVTPCYIRVPLCCVTGVRVSVGSSSVEEFMTS